MLAVLRWSTSLGMKEKAERVIIISWMLGKQALWPNNVCSVKFMTNNYAFYIIQWSYFAPILDSVFEVLYNSSCNILHI